MSLLNAFFAGLLVAALALATPLDLHQKPGPPRFPTLIPLSSPCGRYTAPSLNRIVIDEVDQPMVAVREDEGECVALAPPLAGYFAPGEVAVPDIALSNHIPLFADNRIRGVALLFGGPMFLGLLKLLLRARRQRGAAELGRRQMACI